MSSELYYFPDIEKNSNLNDPTIALDLQHGFNKMLDKNGDNHNTGMQNIYIKNDSINESELAYKKGFEDGKKEGMEAERERVFHSISNLNTAIESLEKTNKDVRGKVEAMASKLAILLAEKIIAKEVSVNKGVIINTLHKAMSGFESKHPLKVMIHPDDCDFLQSIANDNTLSENVEFIPDSSISKGGCIVESITKSVDARIESQLEIVQNAFEELRLGKSDIVMKEQG